MKNILILLLLGLFLTVLPVSSEQDTKPFLAVFCTESCSHDWARFKPDLYFQSSTFSNLDFFLKVVKIRAENRPVVLDIECHGNEEGFLATDRNGSDMCSYGYIISNIDRNLDTSKLTVLLEACHSSVCAYKTLICPLNIEGNTYHLSSFEKPVTFPIYGIGPSVNYDNLVFLQYYYNLKYVFKDLRTYRTPTADNSKKTDLSLRCLTCLLERFKN